MKKKFISLSTLLFLLMGLNTTVHAESIAHISSGESIYSVTASGDKNKPFNVYRDGEPIGQYSIEDVLNAGFKEDDLVSVLQSHKTEKPQPQTYNTVSSDHQDLPSSNKDSNFASIMSYHNDILYPSEKFENVGNLSKYENYGGNRESFEAMLADYAHIARQAGLLPSVMMGQAMLESGDNGGSGLALGNKNIFGIKGEYNGQGTSWDTLEDYGGMVQVNDQFRLYPTYKESVMDYVRLITETDRYREVVNYNTPEGQVQAIKDAGYATDSNYVSKVINIINRYGLTKYDF